ALPGLGPSARFCFRSGRGEVQVVPFSVVQWPDPVIRGFCRFNVHTVPFVEAQFLYVPVGMLQFDLSLIFVQCHNLEDPAVNKVLVPTPDHGFDFVVHDQPAVVSPPSCGRTWPEMYPESALHAKKTWAGAISSGCAGRPIGVSLPKSFISSSPRSAGFSGVHTGP